MTLKEHFGTLKGKTVAWVGDGNNVLHDLMIGSIKLGMNVRVATPNGYSADVNIINQAKALAVQEGVELVFTTDPKVAVKGSNVIVTDTWISMGQEEEAKQARTEGGERQGSPPQQQRERGQGRGGRTVPLVERDGASTRPLRHRRRG